MGENTPAVTKKEMRKQLRQKRSNWIKVSLLSGCMYK